MLPSCVRFIAWCVPFGVARFRLTSSPPGVSPFFSASRRAAATTRTLTISGVLSWLTFSKLVSRLLNDKLTAAVDAGCADSEVGFRAGRGVAEGVFVVRHLAEAYSGSPRQLIPSTVLTMRSIKEKS